MEEETDERGPLEITHLKNDKLAMDNPEIFEQESESTQAFKEVLEGGKQITSRYINEQPLFDKWQHDVIELCSVCNCAKPYCDSVKLLDLILFK